MASRKAYDFPIFPMRLKIYARKRKIPSNYYLLFGALASIIFSVIFCTPMLPQGEAPEVSLMILFLILED